ncbi:MAG: 30S ribosome-binding factor RbfA [Clostridiaceae bacterium]|jgi:ribosome-binding factor A|nr:30S ribosome-binding factor RbfA [Clostridiaceae bacterium]
MGINRINRINEEVKKEVSAIIRELKDPRIAEVTSVVGVDVTKDMKWCNIYVSVFGDETKQKETIEGLKRAAGFVRKEIGNRVGLRYTPEIIFNLDHSIEHGAHINELLVKIKKGGNADV